MIYKNFERLRNPVTQEILIFRNIYSSAILCLINEIKTTAGSSFE